MRLHKLIFTYLITNKESFAFIIKIQCPLEKSHKPVVQYIISFLKPPIVLKFEMAKH